MPCLEILMVRLKNALDSKASMSVSKTINVTVRVTVTSSWRI